MPAIPFPSFPAPNPPARAPLPAPDEAVPDFKPPGTRTELIEGGCWDECCGCVPCPMADTMYLYPWVTVIGALQPTWGRWFRRFNSWGPGPIIVRRTGDRIWETDLLPNGTRFVFTQLNELRSCVGSTPAPEWCALVCQLYCGTAELGPPFVWCPYAEDGPRPCWQCRGPESDHWLGAMPFGPSIFGPPPCFPELNPYGTTWNGFIHGVMFSQPDPFLPDCCCPNTDTNRPLVASISIAGCYNFERTVPLTPVQPGGRLWSELDGFTGRILLFVCRTDQNGYDLVFTEEVFNLSFRFSLPPRVERVRPASCNPFFLERTGTATCAPAYGGGTANWRITVSE